MRVRRPKMTTISLDPRLHHHCHHRQFHGSVAVAEEIEGLIRVTKDSHVERPTIVPIVPCSSASASPHHVASQDVYIDKLTNLWARIYIPAHTNNNSSNSNSISSNSSSILPLLVYFHGGGFCVGSAAWSCYHDFLSILASKANCIIVSVNYRLAPENRLPAAYDDGCTALSWIKQQMINPSSENKPWASRCDKASTFLAGDSAGANIVYHVSARLRPASWVRGLVLIQPFFGGEVRTASEWNSASGPSSALSLAASDAYWRMALPQGGGPAGRDHPWCNPMAVAVAATGERVMVCVSEMDILRDRTLEFCNALAGKASNNNTTVEVFLYRGVGHAFQILHHNSRLAQTRTQEMVSHIKAFIAR